MSYFKINDEIIKINCINFIKYDGIKIMIFTDDIYNLSYVIDSTKTGYNEEKRKIWYNYMVRQIEKNLFIRNVDNDFDDYYTKTFEKDTITDIEID